MRKKKTNVVVLTIALILLMVSGFLPVFAYESVMEITDENGEYAQNLALIERDILSDDYFIETNEEDSDEEELEAEDE